MPEPGETAQATAATEAPTSRRRGGAGSSAGSSAAASSAPFVADPGPAFDPEQPTPERDVPPAPGASVHELGVVPDLWTADRLETILRAQGALTHGAIAVDPDSGEWLWQDAEVSAVAEPLANVLNRYDRTRAAAHVSDELAVAIGFFGYASRSIRERQLLLRERAEEPEQPVTGRAPERPPAPADEPREWRV